MVKESVQFAIWISTQYIVVMFLCFGVFAFPSRDPSGRILQYLLVPVAILTYLLTVLTVR